VVVRFKDMKLKDFILANDVKQAAIARDLSVSNMAVWRWCAGERIPKPAMMAKIYLITGGNVEPGDFYDMPNLRQ
jgi:transcriptional regulator with XRE-family HTH domain